MDIFAKLGLHVSTEGKPRIGHFYPIKQEKWTISKIVSWDNL
jgi:hypothetical protein